MTVIDIDFLSCRVSQPAQLPYQQYQTDPARASKPSINVRFHWHSNECVEMS